MIGLLKKTIALVLALALPMLLAACGEPAPDPDAKCAYSVTVETTDRAPVEGIKLFVYEDDTQKELVCVGTTDAAGKVSFEEQTSDAYVAVLKDIPAGYSAEASYPLVPGDNSITLESRELTAEEMLNVRYDLGDKLPEFTVTDCHGVEYSLSQLLSEKKALVLNFWFINCGPCKMEFPYLQEVYDSCGGDAAFLALNPVDGTDETVSSFKAENDLTFPMAVCDVAWQKMLGLNAYPTTLIIDRDGYICLSHAGMFTDSAALMNAVKYFTRDGYETSFFETIEDIPTVE